LSFRGNLIQAGGYENDELAQLVASVNGVLVGTPPDDYVAQIAGDGNSGPDLTTGWQLFELSLGVLPAGDYTLALGAYNNKKTFNDESSTVLIDDVTVTAGEPAPPPPPPPQGQIFSASFDGNADQFVYVDDPFRGSNQPNYASGNWDAGGGFTGGGLTVLVGGVNNASITNMSGGWQRSFSLDAPTDLVATLRFNMTADGGYEPDEMSQTLLSVDGVLIGIPPDDFLAQIVGDGNRGPDLTTGWQLVELPLGVLSAGNHTIVIGGANNKKTVSSESTTVQIDDVTVSAAP
jgi:hypothetical protein